ncbi:MAG: glycosyltransferase [Dehalococcoidia bacterium]
MIQAPAPPEPTVRPHPVLPGPQRQRPAGAARLWRALWAWLVSLARRRPRPLPYIPPGVVAVIIPAHNEAAVIAATLRSVLRVHHPADIYVFCDGCTDATVPLARRYLPYGNVIDHRQNIGKSRGLEYTLNTYVFPRRYYDATIVDADSTMEPQFLVASLRALRRRNVACVVGQVKARWYGDNIISVYRTYTYTMWHVILKRLQSALHAVSVASGTATTWKVRVLRQVAFDHELSTEDIDLTFQVHRRRLGAIKYVPSAVVWTQDPQTMASYRRQITRWYRAWWEGMRKYYVGIRWVQAGGGRLRLSLFDVSMLLTMLDMAVCFISALLLPALVLHPVEMDLRIVVLNTRFAVLYFFLWQYCTTIASALLVAVITGRPRVLAYSPLFIFFLYMDAVIHVRTLASTARSLYRKGAEVAGAPLSAWASPERRSEN